MTVTPPHTHARAPTSTHTHTVACRLGICKHALLLYPPLPRVDPWTAALPPIAPSTPGAHRVTHLLALAAAAVAPLQAFYLDDEMSGWTFTGNTIINSTTGVMQLRHRFRPFPTQFQAR